MGTTDSKIFILMIAVLVLGILSGGCGGRNTRLPDAGGSQQIKGNTGGQHQDSGQGSAQSSSHTNVQQEDGGAQPQAGPAAELQGGEAPGGQKGTESSRQPGGHPGENPEESSVMTLVNESGITIEDRFVVPEGFERIKAEEGSFGEYLRGLPLKSHGTRVQYYDGRTKAGDVHEAVIDIDVGDRDLQQCADAVMRLRAEYLYKNGQYDKIHFNFTNGFRADYKKWMQGNRISIDNNKTYWIKKSDYSNDYTSFRRYMDIVFAYAGTLSLSKEMQKTPLEDMKIGDVFLKGGSPGHCVIIVDMAENNATGEKLFMVAQSYMPAQDIHILKNPESRSLSPWYSMNFGEKLATPEWIFTKDQLMKFAD